MPIGLGIGFGQLFLLIRSLGVAPPKSLLNIWPFGSIDCGPVLVGDVDSKCDRFDAHPLIVFVGRSFGATVQLRPPFELLATVCDSLLSLMDDFLSVESEMCCLPEMDVLRLFSVNDSLK